ncbi:MAG: DEAD/DEAH box helicase [Candidatus Gracilibacteria bacterium]|nr:DEAD/DEAH box helicase [Candidatus Gracilibacteria bacterium]
MLFKELNLISPILKALEQEGYESPTPIQAQAIPHILEGRDVLGSAQTGTGKTAAFAIPTLQILSRERETSHVSARTIKSLILTPTRELAIQIEESFMAYGQNLSLRHAVIFGGVNQNSQVNKLKSGVDILVATPGRLLDLMNQGFVDLKKVEIFILDEADRMLNMGFIHDVKKVLAKLPAKKQTLFFSATMPKEILSLANSILVNPVKVEVAPVSSTADTVKQSVYFVSKSDKKNLLVDILKNPDMTSVLVFTRTKHGADKVVKDLEKAGIVSEAIHGNKSQNARQRALSNFKNGTTRVLVATDIAARGIDIDDLAYVINYDLSNESETYVHRIGRTGRAGLNGTAISFCDQEEFEYLKDIERLIGRKIDIVENHPFALRISQSIHNVAPKKSNKRPAVAARKQNFRR